MSKIDHEYTEKITCPYCGYETGDSWEAQQDDDTEQCSNCGKTYWYSRDVEVTYCTGKMCRCLDDCRAKPYKTFCLCKLCSSKESKEHCKEGFRDDCVNQGKQGNDFEKWDCKIVVDALNQ